MALDIKSPNQENEIFELENYEGSEVNGKVIDIQRPELVEKSRSFSTQAFDTREFTNDFNGDDFKWFGEDDITGKVNYVNINWSSDSITCYLAKIINKAYFTSLQSRYRFRYYSDISNREQSIVATRYLNFRTLAASIVRDTVLRNRTIGGSIVNRDDIKGVLINRSIKWGD